MRALMRCPKCRYEWWARVFPEAKVVKCPMCGRVSKTEEAVVVVVL